MTKTKNIFEKIKRINARNQEFWSARELSHILGYSEYNKFLPAIERAKMACEGSKQAVELHFAGVSETQQSHNQHGLIDGRKIADVHLYSFDFKKPNEYILNSFRCTCNAPLCGDPRYTERYRFLESVSVYLATLVI